MTVGNFTELLGQVSDFGITGFDSISGADLTILYGLDGDDNLNSTATFGGGELADGRATTILVGGTGKNNYQIRNNSTMIVVENENNDDNILWTTIGSSGLSLEKETSFTAEIDSRHLYFGDTATDQYVILIDWQQPANQIENFDLAEGMVGYEDFVSRYQNSSNYRGNFTWDELAATGEIDLARLGLSSETIDRDIATISQRSISLEIESKGSIFLIGTDEGEFLDGSINNDSLQGGLGDDGLFGFGGMDTLEGGLGNDQYFVNQQRDSVPNQNQILDAGGELDDLIIVAQNTDIQTLSDNFFSDSYLDLRANKSIYGDSAIELSSPRSGIVGVQKLGNDLIIDITRDGVAQPENDLTIFNFFNEAGEAGTGRVERINNILDTQDLIDFVANSAQEQLKDENYSDRTIYRFYNSSSATHFYTADKNERDYVYDNLDNYRYEGASYEGAEFKQTPGIRPPFSEADPVVVHRYLNANTGTHLYTIDSNERNFIEQELDNFNYEGEAFRAYKIAVEGSLPIYRFYSTASDTHFYTPSVAEKDFVDSELSYFQPEGIAYYALPLDSAKV